MFGSIVLAGDTATNTAGLWPSYACAIGQAGDPIGGNGTCVSGGLYDYNNIYPLIENAPLDTTTSAKNLAGCNAPDNGCTGTDVCGGGWSFTNGFIYACGQPCDFTGTAGIDPNTGCAIRVAGQHPQTCGFNVATGQGACVDMALDANGMNTTGVPQPMLAYLQGRLEPDAVQLRPQPHHPHLD